MTSIFRQEKTQRLIGDDLLRGVITNEFWEEVQGGTLSASGSLTQGVQTLAAQGATAFLAAAGMTQPALTIAAGAANLTATAGFTQVAQTLSAGGKGAYLASGALTGIPALTNADGYETFLSSLTMSQPVQILACDGQTIYKGEVSIVEGVPTLSLSASIQHKGTAALQQFYQTLSAQAGSVTQYGVEASCSLTQRRQKFFGSALGRPPLPVPWEVRTNRQYRRFKHVRYSRDGKASFAGWSKH